MFIDRTNNNNHILGSLKTKTVITHLREELSIWLQFFNYVKPPDFQTNDLYNKFLIYFRDFGVDLHSVQIWQKGRDVILQPTMKTTTERKIKNGAAINIIFKNNANNKFDKSKFSEFVKLKTITSHLQTEFAIWIKFFNYKHPKNWFNNELYLLFVQYFQKFGLDVHSNSIWSCNKKNRIDWKIDKV